MFLCGSKYPSYGLNMQHVSKSKDYNLNALLKQTTVSPVQPTHSFMPPVGSLKAPRTEILVWGVPVWGSEQSFFGSVLPVIPEKVEELGGFLASPITWCDQWWSVSIP